jgi:hypothetical protein
LIIDYAIAIDIIIITLRCHITPLMLLAIAIITPLLIIAIDTFLLTLHID